MTCYYQVEDGPWVKGRLLSMNGGTLANFCPEERPTEDSSAEFTLVNPGVLFHGVGITITGYVCGKDERYDLVSVDVRWTKPRK